MTKRSQDGTIAPDIRRLQRELTELVERQLPADGYATHLGRLHLSRTSRPDETGRLVYEPTFCVVAQGSKAMDVGGERHTYDPDTFLLSSVAVPVTTTVMRASVARPYLCVGIVLDPVIVGAVMTEAALPPPPPGAPRQAVDVGPLDVGLLDAVVRLVRLVEAPGEAAFLAPLVHREILYRLLTGPQGARLAQIAPFGGPGHRVGEAVAWLRQHLAQPMRVAALSKRVGMSASSLHRSFRAVTGLSPLQYQKRLRLEEARRLLLHERLDAATAGFRVGYNDASQFTRDYRRLFGAPPRRDTARAHLLPLPGSSQ